MDDLTKNLNDNLSGILSSLDQDNLSNEETQEALQEEIDKLINSKTFDYEEEIKFENLSQAEQDFLLSRNMLMDTLDKNKKISDIAMEMIVVMKNPVTIQMLLEANKQIQNAVKSLTDLHKQFHSIKNGKLRNKVLEDIGNDTETEMNGTDANGNKISF